jgi:hypothetical protein
MPATADPHTDTSTGHDDLTRLAAELTTLGYRATLHTPPGTTPHLHVTNPHATALSERVCAQAGNYWFSWGQPITDTSQPATAAATLARVLRTTGD